MRIIEADLRHIDTPEALQVYLGYILRAPAWYGQNLDALYDILTEIVRPTRLIVLPPEKETERMIAYWPRFLRVLNDAADICPAFSWEKR